MDSGATLLVLEALVTIAGPSGQRQIPLADFFVGPRRNGLANDELLTEIVIPKENLGKPTAFQKFGLRKGQALALVNAAASFWIDRVTSTFTAPRIALGAVAPTVIRARDAEAYLDGRRVTPDSVREAARIASQEAKPITDFRASAGYRRDLVAVLVERALANVSDFAAKKNREQAS
jgi:carbon-monoxide dehydrogenase medium subunit